MNQWSLAQSPRSYIYHPKKSLIGKFFNAALFVGPPSIVFIMSQCCFSSHPSGAPMTSFTQYQMLKNRERMHLSCSYFVPRSSCHFCGNFSRFFQALCPRLFLAVFSLHLQVVRLVSRPAKTLKIYLST